MDLLTYSSGNIKTISLHIPCNFSGFYMPKMQRTTGFLLLTFGCCGSLARD